jgi:hypothetical protein
MALGIEHVDEAHALERPALCPGPLAMGQLVQLRGGQGQAHASTSNRLLFLLFSLAVRI